jgi:hypothetical protein
VQKWNESFIVESLHVISVSYALFKMYLNSSS